MEKEKCIWVFLISPVRGISDETADRIKRYVESLESEHETTGGLPKKVYWPLRDTSQDDPTGGFNICKTNFRAILAADEIHIWYDEASAGSKFDLGGVFMLLETLRNILYLEKKIVIVNEDEVVDNSKKSFLKVFRRLAKREN
jgi:hypothetical protein